MMTIKKRRLKAHISTGWHCSHQAFGFKFSIGREDIMSESSELKKLFANGEKMNQPTTNLIYSQFVAPLSA
jgi:hypothetical protein